MLIARAKLKLKKLIMISKFYIYIVLYDPTMKTVSTYVHCVSWKKAIRYEIHAAASSSMSIYMWLNGFLSCPFSNVIGHNTVIILTISHVQVDNNVTFTQEGSKSNNRFARRTKYIYCSIPSLRALFLHICITDCRLELMLNSTV